jgi:hypothetical protein
LGKGPEKKQCFVEAKELVEIIEFAFREFAQKFDYVGGCSELEAILSGFELGEKPTRVVESARHGGELV